MFFFQFLNCFSFTFSFWTMVFFLPARENGIFVKQCRGRFDMNGTYRFESISLCKYPSRFLYQFHLSLVNWILLLIWFNIESKWSGFIKLTFSNIWQSSKTCSCKFYAKDYGIWCIFRKYQFSKFQAVWRLQICT